MKIINIFYSRLFVRFSKKYLLFSFIAVAFIANGFFVSKVSAETIVDTDIIENTTWTKALSPYIVNTTVGVMEGSILTIEPGVIVKFEPRYDWSRISIDVYGTIIADGTEVLPIYFTSNYDDIGGSTDGDSENCYYENYDGEGNPLGEEICEIIDWYEPYVGDWNGINFISSIDSTFKNVFFRYADDALSFSLQFDYPDLNLYSLRKLGKVV